MADRTEQLLSDILDVLRRQLANQEHAIARQEEAITIQREAVARQRTALKRVWALLVLVIVMILALYAAGWVQWLARR